MIRSRLIPRTLLLLATLLALTTIAAPARADLGGFTITDFDVDLTVESNAKLTVEERITVDFSEPRHGIYRSIPVSYTDPAGFNYGLDLRLKSVTDESGSSYGTKLSRDGAYVMIRIGSANRTVEGRQVYVIRYRVDRALGHYAKHDEIYWNVTGNEWNQAIAHASCTVHLPVDWPADSLLSVAYTGRFGSREQSAAIENPAAGEVRFEATRPLDSLEGMTIAVAFPRGAVRFPSRLARIAQFVHDNWILLAPLGVFFWLWSRYRSRGQDPEGASTVMVRYEPPEGMTPGEIGAIVDEQVDMRDITATLIDLAVRGYLKIEEKEESVLGLIRWKDFSFARSEKDTRELAPHEVKLLEGFFEAGPVVEISDLRTKFYRHIPGIKNLLYSQLVQKGALDSNPEEVRGRYVGLAFLVLFAVIGVGALWGKLNGAIFPNALVFPILAGAASMAVCFAFAPAMPRRTKKGVELRAWARGFEEFVGRVERESLDRDAARNVFEKLLPYAMALGVSARWAKKFEGIYDQPPSWYGGSYNSMNFTTRSFESGLARAMAATSTSMASTPRSSGSSGGGGFSGGGGGGGGGGSW